MKKFLYNLRINMLNRLLAKIQKDAPNQQDFENVIPDNSENAVIAWDKVTKLSEELNDSRWNFPIYTDTTKLLPGFIVYVVGKRAPTAEKPYVTYKPEPRVVSSIHDSGVNGGTVFFTYTHQVVKQMSFNNKNEPEFEIVSEEDVINSPLTKGHAEYICNLLNLQSKRLYEKQLAKMNKTRQK